MSVHRPMRRVAAELKINPIQCFLASKGKTESKNSIFIVNNLEPSKGCEQKVISNRIIPEIIISGIFPSSYFFLVYFGIFASSYFFLIHILQQNNDCDA